MKLNKNSISSTSLKVPFRGFRGVLLFLFCGLLACNPTPIDDPNDEEDLSMYITHVFEYVYAPGQHARDINSETEKRNFIGRPTADVFLGGWGGFIVAGFNHNVPNVAGEFDFEIFSSGVSPEPAVVFVMSDTNGDGLPNETWYELRGSEFENSIRNYKLTYFRPVSNAENITWRDNQGNSGELIYQRQGSIVPSASWWWSETKTDSITFIGTRLPDAYVNLGSSTQHWVVPDTLFTWGYAENNQGTDFCPINRSNKFDISNAVDALGNPVHLPHIRFIKIQSAVFQQAGWLNEVSPEVRGARSLHR